MTSSWRILNIGWSFFFSLIAAVHPHRCFHLLQTHALVLGSRCEVRLFQSLSIHRRCRMCDLSYSPVELRGGKKLARCLSFEQPPDSRPIWCYISHIKWSYFNSSAHYCTPLSWTCHWSTSEACQHKPWNLSHLLLWWFIGICQI